MLNGQKIVVVMPAYNAARTLRQTYDEVMAHGIVDLVIVVDDASHDETVAIARTLPNVQVEVHPENRGYGANQKTCYRLALAAGADIIIMIHPDYQYTPQLIPRWQLLSQAVFILACSVRGSSAEARCGVACLGGNTFQTGSSRSRRIFSSERSFPSTTLAIALFAPAVGAAAIANELQRFCFRQSDPRANHRPWLRHRRGDVPSSLHARSVIDQFP
jgi:Glycosyltransferases involved in cell wall biogenesis